jgi:peptidase inhibitor I78 family protein
MAPQPNPPAPGGNPPDDPDAYVGLLREEAERRARDHGWTTVRSLPTGTVVTMEYVAGRLNLAVEGDRVERCWVG